MTSMPTTSIFALAGPRLVAQQIQPLSGLVEGRGIRRVKADDRGDNQQSSGQHERRTGIEDPPIPRRPQHGSGLVGRAGEQVAAKDRGMIGSPAISTVVTRLSSNRLNRRSKSSAMLLSPSHTNARRPIHR